MTDICLVNALYGPYAYGGAENYVLRLGKALQRNGHDVTVVSTKPYENRSSLNPESKEHKGIETYYFYPVNFSHRTNGSGSNPVAKGLWHAIDTFNVHARSKFAEILDEVDPDVVHTHNLMGISTMIAKPIRDRSIHHVHTLHDYSLICPKSNLLRDMTAPDGKLEVCEDPPAPCKGFAAAKRKTLGEPDVVTAPSQHVIDIHEKHGFFRDCRTQRLQLGVDEVADTVPSPPDEPAVLFVGKHLQAKGLDTLYGAASNLPAVTFHVCGVGPYDEEATKQANNLENLKYHGYVEEDELADLRRTASAAVVPSIWMENSPLTIYESFASGLPVVASDIGGIPELVEEGQRGWLFEPGNCDHLADKIELCCEHSQADIRLNAIDWAENRRMDDHVENVEKHLYSVT